VDALEEATGVVVAGLVVDFTTGLACAIRLAEQSRPSVEKKTALKKVPMQAKLGCCFMIDRFR